MILIPSLCCKTKEREATSLPRRNGRLSGNKDRKEAPRGRNPGKRVVGLPGQDHVGQPHGLGKPIISRASVPPLQDRAALPAPRRRPFSEQQAT